MRFVNFFEGKILNFRSFVLLSVATVMVSCFGLESDLEKQIKIDDKIIAEYLDNNGIQAQKHSTGFYYMQLPPAEAYLNRQSDDGAMALATSYLEGAGAQLKNNDIVSFYYTISKLDGSKIESNEEGEEPVKFRLMSQTIIPEGLDYGIKLMKVGEQYRFYMPSYLAYGSYGSRQFSSHTNFIIDVWVVGVETPTEIDDVQRDSIESYVSERYENYKIYPSGLCFIDSVPGTGIKPFMGDRVVIDFERKYLDNKLIKSSEGAQFMLGSGQAVDGLDEGLKLMKEGGVSVLIMPASIAFKQSVCVIPQAAREELVYNRLISYEVLPYSIVKYVVKLRYVN